MNEYEFGYSDCLLGTVDIESQQHCCAILNYKLLEGYGVLSAT
jgi:hypothetical protein